MKKSVYILLFALSVSLTAQAQSSLKFGIKAGMNISEMRFDQKIINKDNNAGFFVGPMIDVKLPIIGISFDLAALYDQQKVGAGVEDSNLKFIDIPLNVKYNIGLGDFLSAYIATGPQLSFNIGDDDILEHEYELKSSQFSWNIGAGVKVVNHLIVGYHYNIGLGDYADRKDLSTQEVIDTVKKKDGTHHISVAYIF